MEPGRLQVSGVVKSWTRLQNTQTHLLLCWKTAGMQNCKLGVFREKSIVKSSPLPMRGAQSEHYTTLRVSGHLAPSRPGASVSGPGETWPPKSRSGRPSCWAWRGGHVTNPDDGDPQRLIQLRLFCSVRWDEVRSVLSAAGIRHWPSAGPSTLGARCEFPMGLLRRRPVCTPWRYG